MQKSLWRRLTAGLGAGTLLLTVPALALATFGPQAFRSVAVADRAIRSDAAPVATAAPADRQQLLDTWQDTQSIIQPTFDISVMNNAEIASYANTLQGLSFGSSAYIGGQIALGGITASETAFESYYKGVSNSLTVSSTTRLVSAFLHGEERAFSSLAVNATTDTFSRALLAQKETLLQQEAAAFDTWYRNATAGKLSSSTILSQLTSFTASFQAASLNITSMQVTELKTGVITQATPYTAPTFTD